MKETAIGIIHRKKERNKAISHGKQTKPLWNSRSHLKKTQGFEIIINWINYMWYHHEKPCKIIEEVLDKLLLDECTKV